MVLCFSRLPNETIYAMVMLPRHKAKAKPSSHRSTAHSIISHISNGMSMSSFLAQRYSPNNTIITIPKRFTIQKSKLESTPTPSYMQQITTCTKSNVHVKSRHFFDFSTITASKKLPMTDEIKRVTASMRPSLVHMFKY